MEEEKILVESNDEQEIINVDEEVLNSTLEESVDVVEITDIQIVEVGVDSAFASLGNPNDMSVHGNLHGITDPDQHPIAAITGLRAELNSLNTEKTPQTLYSDKIGVANYYTWNYGAYDEVGYFVSLVPETSKIKICDGSDIFGVTVDAAGFIGGQDATVPRDNTYALVATAGLVDVRCESDVSDGDYVISNEHGWAAKTTSNFGYKVVSVNEKHGVLYASVVLGVQACTTDAISKNLQYLESRVGANETNIISAINVANQAYNKAIEVDSSNQIVSDKVDSALDTVDKVVADVEDLGSQVSNSALISTQAKAIAESAATSAESMKNEAIEKADEALTDTSELRKELEAKVTEINTELENSALELKTTKESIETTKNELQDNIDHAVEDLETLEKDLEPLATWPEGSSVDRATSFAGFVARADESSALLATMVGCDFDNGETLAGFMQEATDTHALVSGVAEYQAKDKDGRPIGEPSVAGFIAQVNENTATVQSIAGKGGSLAGLQSQVDGNSASITTLASQTIGDYIVEKEDWNAEDKNAQEIYYVTKTKDYYYYKNNQWVATKDINEAGLDGAIAGVKSTADANSAELDALASYQAKDENGNPIYSIAGIMAHVDKNTSEVSQLAKHNFVDKNNNPVSGAAGVVARVDANQSEIRAIANREFTKNDGTVVTGLAGLNAYVNENESNVSLVANRVAGKYVVVPKYPENNLDKIAKLDTDQIYYTVRSYVENGVTQYVVRIWIYENYEWKYVQGFRNFVTTYPEALSKDTVYYFGDHIQYYAYYNNASWTTTDNPYTAGLTSAIGGIQVVTDDNSVRIDNLVSWQDDTDIAMARIEQKADANGAYIQSTVANMDKYSVGPHSQAYGFTLEQAGSVLEEGMIYVPTISVTEEYEYTDANKAVQTYTRNFTPQYLYKWGKVSGQYRWITVDKNYTETSETNTSSKAVYFATIEPTVSGNFGYWYTSGDTITGTTGTYEPYTLYKWESYVDENEATKYHWVAVATLAGNSQSRAISQVKQTANSIESSVTILDNKYAGTKTWVDDNKVAIQATVEWKGDNSEAIATTIQKASDSSAYIAQIASVKNPDGTINASASIITAVNDDKSGITITADHLNLQGAVTISALGGDVTQKIENAQSTADDAVESAGDANSILTNWCYDNNKTYINGAKIYTGSLSASQITTGTLGADVIYTGHLDASQITTGKITSKNYTSSYGLQIDLDNSTFNSPYFKVDSEGKIIATGGVLGGWSFDDEFFTSSSESVGLYSGSDYKFSSLINSAKQPVRFYCGWTDKTSTEIVMPFCVLADGSLYATAARFWGSNVTIGGDVKIGSDGKTVDNVIKTIPKTTSELANNSGFVTEAEVKSLIETAASGDAEDSTNDSSSSITGSGEDRIVTYAIDEAYLASAKTVNIDGLTIDAPNSAATSGVKFPLTMTSDSSIIEIIIECNRACTLSSTNNVGKWTSDDNKTWTWKPNEGESVDDLDISCSLAATKVDVITVLTN